MGHRKPLPFGSFVFIDFNLKPSGGVIGGLNKPGNLGRQWCACNFKTKLRSQFSYFHRIGRNITFDYGSFTRVNPI